MKKDLLETIKGRYSCRDYEDKTIEPEKINRILEAAKFAPSANNSQDTYFVLVTNKELKKEISIASNNQTSVQDAGMIVVACSNNEQIMRCGQKKAPINAAIALEHMVLQATEEDLGTCWIGSFEPDSIKKILKIPIDYEIIQMLTIGYSKKIKRKPSPRKEISKRIFYELWEQEQKS